jgi:hypothetical protein
MLFRLVFKMSCSSRCLVIITFSALGYRLVSLLRCSTFEEGFVPGILWGYDIPRLVLLVLF